METGAAAANVLSVFLVDAILTMCSGLLGTKLQTRPSACDGKDFMKPDVSFFVTSVGGVRIYVESFPVIDHWTMEHVNTNGRYCCVESGQMYSLRVEYQKLATHAWPALIRLDVVTSQGISEQGFPPFLIPQCKFPSRSKTSKKVRGDHFSFSGPLDFMDF